MKLTNNTARVIYFGDVTAIPGEEFDLDETWSKHPHVADMVKSGELSELKVSAIPVKTEVPGKK